VKAVTLSAAAALLAVSSIAHAGEGENQNERNPLSGPKVGIEVTRDSNQVRQTGGSLDANRNGFGVRGFAGYDAAIGKMAIVGAEIGIGKGGRTTDQASLVAGGRYRVDPGFTYDITARAGVIPTEGLLLYGRAGYRWLETKRSITGQVTGNGDTKITEKGFTYGGGVEYALNPNIGLRAEFNRTNYDRNVTQNKVSMGASFRF
jgi:outer membrane immunogenic protein